MEMPSQIKIAGFVIDIKMDKNILVERGHIGEYAPKYQEIRIAEGLTEQQQKETLIHEVIEAIDSIYSLDLDHDEQLSIISLALHQVFNESHELLSFLKNKTPK